MLVNIFCQIDDFSKLFEKETKISLLTSSKIHKKLSLGIESLLTFCLIYFLL